ncbi:MAG: RimK/LysX family protein [Planctomycetota bacterium]
MIDSEDLPIIGWREWLALPDLSVPRIKAKVDTGARSSSLHAHEIETFRRRGRDFVRFEIHPVQRKRKPVVRAEAELLEMRKVKSSGGHVTLRPVIMTSVALLGQEWEVELTLATRDAMGFRMLLGRQAIRGRMVVDPGRSYYSGPRSKPKKKELRRTLPRRGS